MVSSCSTVVSTDLKTDTSEAYNAKYSGGVTIVFSKKLYLSDTGSNNTQVFKPIYLTDLSTAIQKGGISINAVATANTVGGGSVKAKLSTPVQQCQSVTFEFTNIKVGTSINFVSDISDEYGNSHYNDPLTLKFTLPDRPNINHTLYKPYFAVVQTSTWGGSNAG